MLCGDVLRQDFQPRWSHSTFAYQFQSFFDIVTRPVLTPPRCEANHTPHCIKRLYSTVNPPKANRLLEGFVVIDSIGDAGCALLRQNEPDLPSTFVIRPKPASPCFPIHKGDSLAVPFHQPGKHSQRLIMCGFLASTKNLELVTFSVPSSTIFRCNSRRGPLYFAVSKSGISQGAYLRK